MNQKTSEKIKYFSISQFDEIYLPEINRNTFEQTDSKSLYRHKYKDQLFVNNQLHIVVGTDSGLLVNYLMEQNLPENGKYLFVELTSVLNVLNIDIPDPLKSKITIIQFDDLESALDNEYHVHILRKDFRVHFSQGAKTEANLDYVKLKFKINYVIDKIYFNSRIAFEAGLFSKINIENISANQYPAKILQNKYKGKACIIAAGGPSLDEALDWIKAYKDKLIIIAVSRVALKLHQYGITPHIIVTVDPQKASFDLNTGIFELSKSSLLVNAEHVCPQIISQWNGRSVYLGSRFLWGKSQANIQIMPPTVTNSAIHLATKMGFSKIMLAGTDFCFSSKGVTHTSGTLEANMGPCLNKVGDWVETYCGEQAETPVQLHIARKSLEEEAEVNKNIAFINLSKNAAKIKNIKHIKPQDIDISDSEIVVNPQQILSFIPNHDINDLKADLELCVSEVKQLIEKLKALQLLVNKAIKYASRILKQKNTNDEQNKINHIENAIKAKYEELTIFIKHFGYGEFSKILTTKDEACWDENYVHLSVKNYYQAFSDTIARLLNLLRHTNTRLSFRKKELFTVADLEISKRKALINELCQQWKKHSEIGRIYIWLEQHNICIDKLTQAEIDVIEQAKTSFKHRLTRQEDYKNSLHTLDEKLDDAIDKVSLFASEKNVIGLQKMADYLKPLISEDEKAQRLYHLSLSYKYQFNGDFQKSLDELLLIPEKLHSEIEWSQLIVLAFKLKKIDIAESALSEIVKVNMIYMPQYAHVLRLKGQHQLALNTYFEYLNRFPTDVPVWLKLGQFLVDINQFELATDVFSKVLQFDPQNQVAKKYMDSVLT